MFKSKRISTKKEDVDFTILEKEPLESKFRIKIKQEKEDELENAKLKSLTIDDDAPEMEK